VSQYIGPIGVAIGISRSKINGTKAAYIQNTGREKTLRKVDTPAILAPGIHIVGDISSGLKQIARVRRGPDVKAKDNGSDILPKI